MLGKTDLIIDFAANVFIFIMLIVYFINGIYIIFFVVKILNYFKVRSVYSKNCHGAHFVLFQ